MVDDAIGVALAGFGYAGRVIHAPLILGTAGLRLVAVASPHGGELAEVGAGVEVAREVEGALGNGAVGLVVIATPNETHFELARRALLAGKHVVVEKPFTVEVGEARELVRLARERGRVISVFQNRRWDSDFLTVRKVIESGEIGEVVGVESRIDRWRPEVRDRWREKAGRGAGLWFDLGPHLVDQALVLFGKPEGVYVDLAVQRSGAVVDDGFWGVLRYGGCRRVVVSASMLAGEAGARFRVNGTKGSFVKWGVDGQEAALKRGERPGGVGWGRDEESGVLTVEGVRTEVESVRGDWGVYYSGVRDAILGRGAVPVSGEEGLAVMEVIEAGARSAREGREVGVREQR